jgi:hypothetical protein
MKDEPNQVVDGAERESKSTRFSPAQMAAAGLRHAPVGCC